MGGASPQRVRCGARAHISRFLGVFTKIGDRTIEQVIHTKLIERMSYNPVTVFDAISAYFLEVRNISQQLFIIYDR